MSAGDGYCRHCFATGPCGPDCVTTVLPELRDAELSALRAKVAELETKLHEAKRDVRIMHDVVQRCGRERTEERAAVRITESERDAARRDLEAAERDRDDLAMGVGCIRCSDLLPCERHPRTRELVEKYDR